jgi:hypothetical protein
MPRKSTKNTSETTVPPASDNNKKTSHASTKATSQTATQKTTTQRPTQPKQSSDEMHNHPCDQGECSRHVIDVVIPRDRLNDFRYIQLQLLDAKCNALDYLAKKLNVSLDSLIDKYIPELNPTFHSAIYSKYSITVEESYADEHDDE